MTNVHNRARAILFIACFFLLASCGSSQSPLPPTSSTGAAPPGTQTQPLEARPAASATSAIKTANALAVEIRNLPAAGALEIVAQGAVVDLAPELNVERQRADGSFEPIQNLDLSSMKLVASCAQSAAACVRIDERGLRPVPWSGMSCSSQCNRTCDKNQPLAGRFRFVVKSCDGKTRYEGPVFELPKSG
jgi:hypothetical protein